MTDYEIGKMLIDSNAQNGVDAYKKGRVDAIDEFKDRLLDLCDCGIELTYCAGGNCYKCFDNNVDYSSIVDLAEELKENKE